MTSDPSAIRSGDLFEWATVAAGVRVELLAEVEIEATTLHLRDVAVFPVGVDRAVVGARALVAAARAELFPGLRAAGFTRLRVTGERLTGPRRGRIVDLTIDLERQPR
ncbi:MAG TPA: hypothetical protein VFJ85_15235 [Acidimicrobiales bacterium]|nr:hypothetical protein [Acidimicrobiales bacterium]